MNLFRLIGVLAVVGVIMYAINAYFPMKAEIKKILNVVVVIGLLLWLLSLFSGYLPNIPVGK